MGINTIPIQTKKQQANNITCECLDVSKYFFSITVKVWIFMYYLLDWNELLL